MVPKGYGDSPSGQCKAATSGCPFAKPLGWVVSGIETVVVTGAVEAALSWAAIGVPLALALAAPADGHGPAGGVGPWAFAVGGTFAAGAPGFPAAGEGQAGQTATGEIATAAVPRIGGNIDAASSTATFRRIAADDAVLVASDAASGLLGAFLNAASASANRCDDAPALGTHGGAGGGVAAAKGRGNGRTALGAFAWDRAFLLLEFFEDGAPAAGACRNAAKASAGSAFSAG